MKKLLALSLVAIALALPGSAQAQHMDINTIIAGIGGSDFLRAAGEVHSAATVRVVRLSSLAGADAAAGRLSDVADLKSDDLQYLQSALVINPMTRAALNGAGVSLDQIVSIEMAGDSAAIIYANDL